MKGYSKIGFVKRNKSKSLDISDLPSSLLPPKKVKKPPISKNTPKKPTIPNSQPDSQIPKQMRKPVIICQHAGPKKQEGQEEDEEEEEEVGGGGGKRVESFGAVLRRNCSVSSNPSSSSSHRFSCTVKRAFSLRRSSSVSERYSRIHDQPAVLASPIDDFEEESIEARSLSPKKQKKGKITKAWKKLFGL